ncbi:hypothetical protein MTO96_019889 [Rhipicephalus appendiculatus]
MAKKSPDRDPRVLGWLREAASTPASIFALLLYYFLPADLVLLEQIGERSSLLLPGRLEDVLVLGLGKSQHAVEIVVTEGLRELLVQELQKARHLHLAHPVVVQVCQHQLVAALVQDTNHVASVLDVGAVDTVVRRYDPHGAAAGQERRLVGVSREVEDGSEVAAHELHRAAAIGLAQVALQRRRRQRLMRFDRALAPVGLGAAVDLLHGISATTLGQHIRHGD